MSQWGAYGWAVDQGWNAAQILDHYYGGTTAGDADTNGTIDVQLKALDGAPTVGVVSYVGAGNVNWAGNVAASMYATEVAPNSFQVYRAPTVACPTVTALTVPDGPIGQGSSDTAGVTQIQIFLNTFQAPGDLYVDGLFGNQTAMRLASWQIRSRPRSRPDLAPRRRRQGAPVDRYRCADGNVDADRGTGRRPDRIHHRQWPRQRCPDDHRRGNLGARGVRPERARDALSRIDSRRGRRSEPGDEPCPHRGLPPRCRPQGDLRELGRRRRWSRPPGRHGPGSGRPVVRAATWPLGQRHLRLTELPGVLRSSVAGVGRKPGRERRGQPIRQCNRRHARQGSAVVARQ